jgi:hypothetical protein
MRTSKMLVPMVALLLASTPLHAQQAARRYVCGTDLASGGQACFVLLPAAKFTLNVTAGVQTAAQGDMTGAAVVTVQYTLVGAAALTTRTATQLIADAGLAGLGIGDSWMVEIENTNAGTITLTAGAGVTLTGTATIATTISRRYVVTITAAGAVTFQMVSSGATT